MSDFSSCLYSPAGADDVPLLTGICAESVFGADLYTLLALGETESCFKGTENGIIEAGLSFSGGRAVFCSRDGGCVSLSAFEPRSDFAVMEYRGETPGVTAAGVTGRDGISGIYSLLQSGGYASAGPGEYLVRSMRCINRGLCGIFAVCEGDAPVSTAAVTAANRKYALIGDVFTKNGFESRGFARRCVLSAAAFALVKGLEPIVYCEKEMISFYEKLGFSEVKNPV